MIKYVRRLTVVYRSSFTLRGEGVEGSKRNASTSRVIDIGLRNGNDATKITLVTVYAIPIAAENIEQQFSPFYQHNDSADLGQKSNPQFVHYQNKR
jgi:hypothetical protein